MQFNAVHINRMVDMLVAASNADKNVKIREVRDVSGEEDHYIYISFGANI